MRETRSPFLFGFLVIFSIITFSLYLEFVRGIYPCPLCELQRITFVLLGILFCVGCFLHRFRIMRYALWLFAILTSILGISLATKQVWLQYYPENATGACGAGLLQLVKMFPVSEVFQQIFAGSAECTEKGWVFLSLGLAEWALIAFGALFLFSIYHLIREFRDRI